MPYRLVFPAEVKDDLNGQCSEKDARIVLAYCHLIQETLDTSGMVPASARGLQQGGYYTQLENHWYIGWDLPDGCPSPSEMDAREYRIRVFGFGRTIKTYEYLKRVFPRWIP